ncbi:hypothetical protein HaLaN_27415, partial [Haematococcus lacustris]
MILQSSSKGWTLCRRRALAPTSPCLNETTFITLAAQCSPPRMCHLHTAAARPGCHHSPPSSLQSFLHPPAAWCLSAAAGSLAATNGGVDGTRGQSQTCRGVDGTRGQSQTCRGLLSHTAIPPPGRQVLAASASPPTPCQWAQRAEKSFASFASRAHTWTVDTRRGRTEPVSSARLVSRTSTQLFLPLKRTLT